MSINLSLYLGYYDLIKQNRTISIYEKSNDHTRCDFIESGKVLLDENLKELSNITINYKENSQDALYLHINSTCCSKTINFSIHAEQGHKFTNSYEVYIVLCVLFLGSFG